MAINLNSGDSSPCSSPRLSFSHDVTERNPNPSSNNEEFGENRLDDISLLSSEFNFCVFESCPESETFPADDLFYNGVIIPTQMKQKLNSMKQEQELTTTTTTTLTTATIVREQRTPSSKSMLWGFRRSSSLNCENNNEYKKSLSRWSMPHLFRSKSTGSSSSTGYHHHHKQSHKNSSSNNNNGKLMMNNNNNNNNNGSSSNNQWVKFPASSSASQKPPVLKKSGSGGGGSYVNVLRNNGGHALNVPPPYIAKGTSDLLGFGSFFRHGIKDKKTKN